MGAAIVLSYSFMKGFKLYIVFELLVNKIFRIIEVSLKRHKIFFLINVFIKVFLFVSET